MIPLQLLLSEGAIFGRMANHGQNLPTDQTANQMNKVLAITDVLPSVFVMFLKFFAVLAEFLK
jgi:hypothetical protein